MHARTAPPRPSPSAPAGASIRHGMRAPARATGDAPSSARAAMLRAVSSSALAVALLVAPLPAAADDDSWWAGTDGDAVEVGGTTQPGDAAGTTSPQGGGPVLTQSMRAPVCQWEQIGTGRPLPCPDDPVPALAGCPAEDARPSLWRRARRTETTPWGVWTLVGPPVCATRSAVTPAMVLAELRRLPLAPSPLVVEPGRGWVLLNLPTAVHADGAPQTLTTTILGTRVTVTATPATYAWDFGDGATVTTTDPGRAWPAATITHAYAHEGNYRIAPTTTWAAVYTVAGDPAVREVPGTATTTTTSGPIAARERRAHLVAASCAEDEDAPGC